MCSRLFLQYGPVSITTLILYSQDVIRRLAAFARVWKHLNPVFSYCESLGCIPGDVVTSVGYNVRTYVNNKIRIWPDRGQIARSAGYQQLHWLDVRVAVPPLYTAWIDHKRSLTGRSITILWSIYIHPVSGQFSGESSLLRVLQSPSIKPKASYLCLPLLIDSWGTYSIAGYHHYSPTS
jgi:hypothetical protein